MIQIVYDPAAENIGGMVAFARGLKITAAIREEGRLQDFVSNRYKSWNSCIGAKITNKQISLSEVSDHAFFHFEISQ